MKPLGKILPSRVEAIEIRKELNGALKLVSFAIVHIWASSLTGQTISPMTIATTGQSLRHSSGVSMDFTIGELAIKTYQTDDVILSEGLHQANLIIRTTTSEKIWRDIKVFPNPSSGLLQITTKQEPQIKVELRHISGKLIGTYSIYRVGDIDISELPPGIYLFTLITEHEKPYSIPLTKI